MKKPMTTAEQILCALKRNRGSWITTTMLSERIGVTRTACSKWLHELMKESKVDGRPSVGERGNSNEWKLKVQSS